MANFIIIFLLFQLLTLPGPPLSSSPHPHPPGRAGYLKVCRGEGFVGQTSQSRKVKDWENSLATRDRPITMKLFALLFAVGLLSASWANPFFQDEPRSKWEETMDVFWDYVTKAANVADDITAQIRTSQLSKELDGLITDTIGEVETYTEDLRSKFGPYTQEMQEHLMTEVSTLTGKLRNDMEETKGRLLQYSHDTRLMIDHNVDNVKSQFNLLMRKLKKRLTKDAEELRQKLRTYAEEMRTNTGEKVSSIRENLEPYFSNVHEKGQERIQALQQALGEQGRMVHQQLSSRVQELQNQFQEKLQEVKKAFDQAVDKLRQLVNPILEDVGVQAETEAEEINQEE